MNIVKPIQFFLLAVFFSLLTVNPANASPATDLQACQTSCLTTFTTIDGILDPQGYQQCLNTCQTNYTNAVNSANAAAAAAKNAADTAANARRIIDDQRTRQVVRQISSYINSRIARDINPTFFGPARENPKGASADGSSALPDSLWSGFSWSRLSNNGNTNGTFDADIFQTTTGVDKKIGNFYLGTTLDYAGSTDHLQTANMNGSNHIVGITPYAAYVINPNLFISALSGYHYSTTNYRGAAPDTQTDAYQTEIDLNGLKVIDHWFMKGKAGARYLHLNTRIDGLAAAATAASQNNLDSWTYLCDLEGGYSFDNGLRAFTGVLFEHNDTPMANLLFGNNNYTGNNIFYYSAGADYSVTKKFTLGTKFQTDLNNNSVNLSTITLNARIWFD